MNRQYELNNNADLDNGVYNKFVNQSSSSDASDHATSPVKCNEEDDERLSSGDFKEQMDNQQLNMFDSNVISGDDCIDDEQNSLVTSMNGAGDFDPTCGAAYKRISNVP